MRTQTVKEHQTFLEQVIVWHLQKLSGMSEDRQTLFVTLALLPAVSLTLISGLPWWWKLTVSLSVVISPILAMLVMASAAARLKSDILLRHNRSLGDIQQLGWRDFESFVEALFRLEGYEVVYRASGGADGGIDLMLEKDNNTTIVQCKHHWGGRIGPRDVRALYGVLKRGDYNEAVFVTSGDFAPQTKEEFEGVESMTLIDAARLVERPETLQDRLPPEEKRLAGPVGYVFERMMKKVAVSDSTTIHVPRCEKCGETMQLTFSKKNAERFWGCKNWKAGCRGSTAPLRPGELDILDPNRGRQKRFSAA